MTLSRTHRRLAAAVLAATAAVSTIAPVAAKELTSGGGGGGTTTCNPVSSLKYKGDARVGETGLSSIDVDYVVKSCTGAPVTADVRVFESANPSVVVWDLPGAALSGRFTVFGVKVNFSYTAKVTVRDAATGAVVGSQQIYVAAVRKTGV